MRTIISILIPLLLLGCGPAPEQAAAPTVQAEGPPAVDPIVAAVADATRPAADVLRDEGRRPAEVLAFFGVQPGMQVLDVFAGGGYYTEILSHLLGPDGRVTMFNNQAYVDFTQAELDARFADGRLPNVDRFLAAHRPPFIAKVYRPSPGDAARLPGRVELWYPR